MIISASAVDTEVVEPWRDMYRLEMGCQIIHDSIHHRPGWTQEYALNADGVRIGYGSLAMAGPWKDKPTVYEFYLLPAYRVRVFEIFECLLQASGAAFIEVQSNDALLTSMLHTHAHDMRSESILFEDGITTNHSFPGTTFRRARAGDISGVSSDQLKWHGVVEVEGAVVGSGGILFHYNRPYGDIYMEIKESFRRRGFGSFLVQELKRICYEGGNIPAARCNPSNEASRRTLQKSGFIPCGHILRGSVRGHNSGLLP